MARSNSSSSKSYSSANETSHLEHRDEGSGREESDSEGSGEEESGSQIYSHQKVGHEVSGYKELGQEQLDSEQESDHDESYTTTPEEDRLLQYHLELLKPTVQTEHLGEVAMTPIFTTSVLKYGQSITTTSTPAFPQYGLLAGISLLLPNTRLDEDTPTSSSTPPQPLPPTAKQAPDPRLFHNIAAPSSTFICGSQGSGKSHTLSCLLENSLIPSPATVLPTPLCGLVFHYDTFISDEGGSPCEAAYLASNPGLSVRVLCAPTNLRTIQRTYQSLPQITITPLRIHESDLNTSRMLDLMAVYPDNGPVPLYLGTVYRILREMRIEQQEAGWGFRYQEFKTRIGLAGLTAAQLGPLNQRLDMLESFMPGEQTGGPGKGIVIEGRGVGRRKGKRERGVQDGQWVSKSGYLTIVDLSCPCVTPENACSLFNICLSIFLEQTHSIGRIIALDEAHKYMTASPESQTLTKTLLDTIRLQRHLGARIIISTQEPTISPALLDLCSVTIVHRFTSPEWLRSLRAHLAGVAGELLDPEDENGDGDEREGRGGTNGRDRGDGLAKRVFQEVANLGVGEALLFCPSAVVGLERRERGQRGEGRRVKKLGAGYLKVRVRARLTEDGGVSVMAV